MYPVLSIIALSIVGVMADYFLKRSTLAPEGLLSPWFWGGALVYALTAFGWFYALKHMKLANVGVIYAVTTVIVLAIVGVVFFKEHLSWREIVGIVMAIGSLLLLSRFA